MRDRGRKWCQPAFFVPREVSLWTLPLRDALQEEQIICPRVPPGVLQITVSMPSASLFPQLFACLLSRSREVLSGLHPSQPHWPLKLQVLSFTGYKNSWTLACLIFQTNGFGEMFSLCVPICSSLSLSPFSTTTAPSPPQNLQSNNSVCLFSR